MKTFTFGIRETPKGATAWMRTPSGRLQEKRFVSRMGGTSQARVFAVQWIEEKIHVIEESVALFDLTGPVEFIREDQQEGSNGCDRETQVRPVQEHNLGETQ